MRIRSLEIQGFKSFPDKTVLTFDPGITAIVGPNGSGKSNISDAVRWVLGEQSTKSLRGSKMEDVVFNGTSARRPRGFAEVSLSIDNGDRRLAFDRDEVRVTRRYYRSGESEYLLNGASVRLKDVHELFMDTGLGRDGYSVISQGKISEIVSGRSEDRREMLEEAAGISRYRYRKAEAERRLAMAQDNLSRLHDILQELENRVGPLGEQAEKARKFLAYAEEKKGLEIGLWLQSADRLARSLREQEERLDEVRLNHEDVSAELTGLESAIDKVYASINGCVAQMDAHRRQMADNDRIRAELTGANAVSGNDIAHFQSQLKRIAAENEADALTERELAAAAAERKKQQDSCRKTAAALQKDIAKMEKDAAASLERLYQFVREESALREELAAITAALSDARTADATAESTMAEIRDRQTHAEAQRQEAEAHAGELEAQLTELAGMRKAQQEEQVTLTNQMQGYTLRMNAQKRKLEERTAQAEKLRLDAESERRRVKLLEDLEKSFEGFAHSVKTVMQESTRGTLAGIHGPVSRIVQVPEDVAAAIETALGGAMQHIVCATENDAKRAIALLKQRDGGRATFLPMTSVKGSLLREPGLAECPGFVGIASELVTCDPQYEQICRSLLGRIAVAEDLNAAVAMARKFGYRFRIVTLDGQVVNAGGSLTGGSMTKNAGLLSRAAQIEKARRLSEQLAAKAEQARQQLRVLQEASAADQAAVLQLQSRRTALQEDMIRSQGEENRLRGLLEQARQTCRRQVQEQQEATARLAELTRLRAAAEANRAEAEGRMTDTRQKLERLATEKSLLQAQRDVAAARIAQRRMELLGAEKDLQQIAEGMEALRRQSSDQQERRKQRAAETAELNRRIADANAQIAERTAQAASLERQTLEAGAAIAELSDRRGKLEQEQTRLRSAERAAAARRETCARELARLEEQRDHRQKEYEDIQRRLWEEYELTQREARAAAAPVDNPAAAQRRLTELKNKIRGLGAVHVGAIEEYKEVRARYDFMKEQLGDAEQARKELLSLIDRLTDEMKKRFLERFETINAAFGETFRELFGGGMARLTLSDPSNVLTSPIEITIQPQGKIITHIDALSGGEKSLAAIALYFAIMKVSPTPFCILDEIEAALDDVNVTRFAAYLRKMSPRTQYIAITHRRGTMEEADVLYGVTMQEKGVSKLLRLPVSEVEEKLGIH